MNRLAPFVAVAVSLIALAVALLARAPAVSPVADGDLDDAPATSSAKAPPGELEERITSLELTASSLLRRVEALERASAPKPGTPAAAAPVADGERRELAALRSDVNALLTGEALSTDSGRQRFKELLRSVQDEVFAERAREREAAREQERTERFKRFVAEARLSGTQEQDLARLLDTENEQRRGLREQLAGVEGGGRARREAVRTLTQRTNEEARRILDAEQFQKYEQMRQEGRRGGGGRTRPGPQATGAPR